MGVKCFFDTNILLYLIENDERRTAIAQELVDAGGVISVQVLNEFANVAAKKAGMHQQEIVEALDPVRDSCEIVALDLATHDLAMSIQSATNFGIYDANIIAAAERSGCDVLYSEDMSRGQRVGRVTICNPFMVA